MFMLNNTISAEDVDALRNDPKYKIIDVRTPGEFAQVHIPEAENIPLNELPRHLEELKKFDGTLILHCRTSNRSEIANHILSSNGITNTKVMTDGMVGWERKNLEVVRGEAAPNFLSRILGM